MNLVRSHILGYRTRVNAKDIWTCTALIETEDFPMKVALDKDRLYMSFPWIVLSADPTLPFDYLLGQSIEIQ
jgi:hypothetical protein